ncbi:hypothetical protein [Amycolatopsis sp. MJM2582]|uniref:hypothetical protein n=1 Tax=Amycolatopsis sp. MJM2582 TaxID=1427749 RepID=UPI000AF9F252|nr:hypothetical protein [Amycolatopsis sp. MJM2582]
MTTSTVTVQEAAHPDLAHAAWIADLVDHAAIDVPRSLTEVTDAGPLDREDAGEWLSGLLGRWIEHRHSASEHLFVDVTTHRAVRLVQFRCDTGVPMFYMAQSPGTGCETDFYRQLVDAARSAPAPGDS